MFLLFLTTLLTLTIASPVARNFTHLIVENATEVGDLTRRTMIRDPVTVFLNSHPDYHAPQYGGSAPACEGWWLSLDHKRIVGYGEMWRGGPNNEAGDCGSCLSVCGPEKCEYMLVIDSSIKGKGYIDMSPDSLYNVVGDHKSPWKIDVEAAKVKECEGIWNGERGPHPVNTWGGNPEDRRPGAEFIRPNQSERAVVERDAAGERSEGNVAVASKARFRHESVDLTSPTQIAQASEELNRDLLSKDTLTRFAVQAWREMEGFVGMVTGKRAESGVVVRGVDNFNSSDFNSSSLQAFCDEFAWHELCWH